MRIVAISKKVLIELFRDKRTLALVFVAPILILWLMNTMFSANSSTDVTLATVDVPSSLVTTLDDIKHVAVKTYDSNDSAKKALKNHKIDGVITYSEEDGYKVTYANTDSTKTAITRQALKGAIAGEQTKSMLANIKKILPANAQLPTSSSKIHEYYNYGDKDTGFFTKMIPILIGFITFFFVFLISGMALLKERTTGTLDRLLATPVKRSEIVIGYMISYGIIAILQTFIITMTSIWVMKIDVVGNIFDVIIVSVLLGLVALVFGFLLSTIAKSEFQMMQFIPLIVMPQLFFSGLIPLDSMADWVKILGKILPLNYSGHALTKIILEGGSLSDVSGDIGVLVLFLVVLTVANIIGLKRYRKV
ncbi:MAG: ABC transporter permease [Streptococcus sp.]|nr:ABC transporter permease [Streptococcus sp.]